VKWLERTWFLIIQWNSPIWNEPICYPKKHLRWLLCDAGERRAKRRLWKHGSSSKLLRRKQTNSYCFWRKIHTSGEAVFYALLDATHLKELGYLLNVVYDYQREQQADWLFFECDESLRWSNGHLFIPSRENRVWISMEIVALNIAWMISLPTFLRNSLQHSGNFLVHEF